MTQDKEVLEAATILLSFVNSIVDKEPTAVDNHSSRGSATAAPQPAPALTTLWRPRNRLALQFAGRLSVGKYHDTSIHALICCLISSAY